MSLFREAITRQVEGIHQADAVEWLASLPPESVDLIITDPAYESLEKHRARGTTTRLSHSKASSNDWFPVFPNSRFPDLLAQVYHVLRPDTHFYLQCDEETADVVKPLGRAAGFTFWKSLIWDKGVIGMGYHYRNQTERVLFFEKGKRRSPTGRGSLNDLGVSDLLRFKRVHNGFPTEKPVELYELLIRQSTSLNGDERPLVVDPFVGSGACGEAAFKLGRRFGGCDISDAAIRRTRQRLAPWLPASEPVHISVALASAGLDEERLCAVWDEVLPTLGDDEA
jgi:site-specific DNA-methyltransferase (adenine-specific)